MKRLFADTYCWLAYLNPKDGGHAHASRWLERVQTGIVSTEWILLEVADAMSDPKNRNAAAEFIRAVRADSGMTILGYDRVLHERGFALYASRPDKAWSLTDCISFVAMEMEDLTEALTGDRHFEQAGFVALLK
jgi:uncharacterized protein